MRAISLLEGRNVQGIIRKDDIEKPGAVNQAAKEIVKLIKTQSSEWLREKGDINALRGLAHGNGDHAQWLAFTKETRKYRRPVDSSPEVNTIMNLMIDIAGGEAHRNNSIFVTGNQSIASSYGQEYIIFPLGEYHYTWSPVYKDWFAVFTPSAIRPGAAANYVKITPKAREYAEQEMKKFISYAEKDDPTYLDYVKKNYDKLFMDQIRKYYGEQTKQDLQQFMDPGIYDFDKVKEDIWVDKGLDIALKKGHEIMLQCDTALFLDIDFYDYAIKDKL